MKNLLLLLALLITTSTVFAQLYVTPNTTTNTDSYIYVSDEVLFVEQDINLVKNENDVNTEASIYLRNDGQLIQGATISNNSGTGSLSVYQTIDSTSNNHYTFWHSPVGKSIKNDGVTAKDPGNTNAGVKRLYDVDNVTKSTLVLTTTGPDGDATTDPITISTKWIYTRQSSAQNETEASYTHVGAADGIKPEEGFIMKGVGTDPGAGSFNSQLYDFRGRPHNGNINVPINSGDQWTLAGNPYASAIDLKIFFADNIANGITAILYWDEPKDSEFHHDYNTHTGGYGVWVPGSTGGDTDPGEYTKAPFRAYNENQQYGPDTGLGADYNRRYAPIGQGFVVQTNFGVGNDIEFKNSQRVFRNLGDASDMRIMEENDNTANRSDGSSTPVTPKIRLHIEYIDGPTRELLLIFHDDSTDGYDPGLDAPLPINTNGTDAYFPIMTDNGIGSFAIQTMPYEIEKTVPLALFTNDQRNVRVMADEVINIPGIVYLWDSQEDTFREIRENTEFVDNSFILPTGMYDDRYFIVFKNRRQMLEDSEGTKLQEEVRATVGFFQNNPYRQMEVSNPEGYDIKSAALYDMTGKLVASKNNVGTVSNFNISTSNLADGVYLVKLVTSENIDIDYKMIIKNN